MKFFEQVVLIDPATARTVIERRWDSGEIEYWSVMNIPVQKGGQNGNVSMPFKIEIESAFTIPDGELMGESEFDKAMLLAARASAFDNFDTSMHACEEGAREQIKQQFAEADRRERSKILIANAANGFPIK